MEFKMWKRWLEPIWLNSNTTTMAYNHNVSHAPVIECAVRAEVDDKKMRDVFEAYMNKEALRGESAICDKHKWNDACEQLDAAYKRARQ